MSTNLTSPGNRLRIGLANCEEELSKPDLSEAAKEKWMLLKRNILQALSVLSSEGRKLAEVELSTADRNGLMEQFIEDGRAQKFTLTTG